MMQVCTNMKKYLQDLVGSSKSNRKKHIKLKSRERLEISAPFNFKKETAEIPGLTQDEISMLREKAAASCLGVAYADSDPDETPDYYPNYHQHQYRNHHHSYGYNNPRQSPQVPLRSNSTNVKPSNTVPRMNRKGLTPLSSSATMGGIPRLKTISPISPFDLDFHLGSPASPVHEKANLI
ncbi:hypothetical protein QBC46DRAFT_45455 [Diplogelasinospora grovesii]|uniref:Uncharacterized protein n=1 Tax=Diplogelasinospora grovesii TaxID=303347 RepID=A0AAN6MYE0_9PEZI|nr:hypothetical protein QBC46DRAFT_45455 [Diplogelasinospora grovesii]